MALVPTGKEILAIVEIAPEDYSSIKRASLLFPIINRPILNRKMIRENIPPTLAKSPHFNHARPLVLASSNRGNENLTPVFLPTALCNMIFF